jgi:hypothetical protein
MSSLRGEDKIAAEHIENNKTVRTALKARGIVAEDLPPREDIKKVERRFASETKKLGDPTKPKLRASKKKGYRTCARYSCSRVDCADGQIYVLCC